MANTKAHTSTSSWTSLLMAVVVGSAAVLVPLLFEPTAVSATAVTPTAYVANQGNDSVTPIDLATGTAGTAISGGGTGDPLGIAITPNGQTAYLANDVANSVTPIDLVNGVAGKAITGGSNESVRHRHYAQRPGGLRHQPIRQLGDPDRPRDGHRRHGYLRRIDR